MDSKLNGWKIDSLSFAGRLTLVKYVLAAIPSYAMQTTQLPVNTCKEVDKRIRNMVWGSSVDKRRIHLMNWDKICTYKEDGGLILKKSRDQNNAILMKLAFGVLTRPNEILHTFKHIKSYVKWVHTSKVQTGR
jgi:hypothetical protein